MHLSIVRNDMNAKVFGLHKGKFWTLYETAESRDVVLTSLGSDDLPANSSEQYKIRCAEVVIMKEEETWGAHSRDPDGRIVPRAQVDIILTPHRPRTGNNVCLLYSRLWRDSQQTNYVVMTFDL